MSELDAAIKRQYGATDPLKVRMRTHALYEERRLDLDVECTAALELSGNEAILDVGCGPGRFLLYLRQDGHAGPLAGLDQSPAMLAEARALTGGSSPPVALVRGEASRLPFPDGSFQRVVARHMLYHVPRIPAALREFRRVLTPGGSLLAVTNVEGYLPKINALRNDLLRAFALPLLRTSGLSLLPHAFVLRGRMGASFQRNNGRRLLAAAFDPVEETLLSNALVFREPEPIADYIASTFASLALPAGSDLQERMHAWLVKEAGRRLAAEGGVWRDPKAVVLFRCRVH